MAEDTSAPLQLFHEVTFHIVLGPKLSEATARETARLLLENGAKESSPRETPHSAVKIDLEEVTHIISADIDFPGYSDAENYMISVVTPEWVTHSLQKKRVAHVRPYTPDPRFYFSGVTATVAELPSGDKEAIVGGIIAMGGQYSNHLTKFTTHVVSLNMDNDKCKQAVGKKLNVKIVLPHWFDDCLKLNRRIDEAPYILPNPEIERLDSSQPIPFPVGPDLTYSYAPDGGPMAIDPPSPRPSFTIFENKKIKLGEDLGVNSRLRGIISTILVQARGVVVENAEEADVYVCRFREGADYVNSSRRGAIVGNLIWLYWMFAHGEWTNPLNRLLHYPIVKGGLVGMQGNIITVSNYGGDARLYLENLIEASGAKFTKSMKADNTHLITARSHSEKCTAAQEWNIHMVNHLWLEESYAKWEVQSMTNPRYTHFPRRTNLMEVVGQTAVDAKAIEQFFLEEKMELDAESPPSGEQIVGGSTIRASVHGESTSPASEVSTRSQHPTPKPKANIRTAQSTPQHSKRKRAGTTEPPPSTSSSGRRAKDAAVAKLHDTIMPDVMMYEQEQRRKGGLLGARRRRSNSSGLEDARPPKKRTSSAEPQFSQTTKNKKKRPPKPTIHLLMTAYRGWVDHPDKESSDKRKLADIGIQCVAEPDACTHVAAPKIVRTEKFCCALAKAPTIVSSDWVEACLMQEVIVPTDDYLLSDPEAEARLNMNLQISLSRAQKNAGKLLEGQTVYCTPTVHGGFETCKKIIEANGGVCINFRLAKKGANISDDGSDKLVLLSGADPADIKLHGLFFKLCKTLGKEPVVYKTDWLLDLAMTQKIVWDEKYELNSKQ